MFQNSEIVKKLFYLNVFLFIVTLIGQSFGVPVTEYLALYPISDEHFQFYQFLSSMFMHGGVLHLAFNMLALLSFGPDVENQLGERKFIVYYLIMGFVASIFQMTMAGGSMIGASGAIFGLLVYYTMLNPDAKLAIIFLPFIGFKAKYFTAFMVAIELYLAIQGGGNIGHWAHFGGAVAGFVLFNIQSKFKFNF